jgi:protein-tyrosine phosphatase
MSNMSFRQLPLQGGFPGTVYLHSLPGRRESWERFLEAASAHLISDIICLTPASEIAQKSPDYSEALKQGLSYDVHHFPIPDYGLPENEEELVQSTVFAADLVRNSHTLLIHCGAGIGRTGMFAACLLLALNYDLEEALQTVRHAGSAAETMEQRRVIEKFASNYA